MNRQTITTLLLLGAFGSVLLLSCDLTDSTKTYTLTTTASPEEGGIITPSVGDFSEGEQITLRAQPNEGWQFVRWEGDINLSANPLNHRMNDHLMVIGVFEKRSYPLNITIEGEGSVREELIQQKVADYDHGTLVRLTAEPAQGWGFVEWSGDAEGEDISVEIAVDEEKNVTASFAKVPVSLTLNVFPEDSGSVTGSGDYEQGVVVNITASPKTGYEFVNWTGDIGSIANENAPSTTVTIPANNISLTANFNRYWPRDTQTTVVEVTSTTGRVWMDRNLGASRVATSRIDTMAFGDLYQWGRAADGHQRRNSTTLSSFYNFDQPGHGSFIIGPSDWRNPRNNNLWQGVNGINNPCPEGFRLPTEAEWEAERGSWGSNDSDGAYDSPLKLTVAGFRDFRSGSVHFWHNEGDYWSSTVVYSYAWSLNFSRNAAQYQLQSRAYGLSVRCIKD